jgi:hypothetical protein
MLSNGHTVFEGVTMVKVGKRTQSRDQTAKALQDAIEAMIGLANGDMTAGEIEKRFGVADWGGLLDPAAKPLKPGPGVLAAKNSRRTPYEIEHQDLRKLLNLIVRDQRLSPRKEAAISQLLEQRASVKVGFSNGRIIYQPRVDSVQAGVAFGVAALFETGAVSRLRRCGECEDFFLTVGKGNRQLYCSEECAKDVQRAQGRERQRRHRDGQREE